MKAMSTLRSLGRRKLCASIGACSVLFIGLFLSPEPAGAAWEFVPDLGIGAETEDNPRLNPDILVTDRSAATGAVLAAGASIATFNERGFLSFDPALMSYRYSDTSDSELESDDWYFDGRGEYQWQTVTAGFNASFAQERLLSSELTDVDSDGDPDTDDIDGGDTGRLLFINEDRERYRVSPYVSFRVSERNSLRLEATKYGYSYSGGDLSFRTGFDTERLSAGIYRNVDARNVVSAVMSVETYEAEATRNTTDTVTIEGAFTRPLSQLWTLNLAAGVLRSDFEFLTNQQLTDSATTDYTMRLGVRKRAERSRMNLDFIRNVYPSASGFSSIRRELRMYYDRTLTQRVTARFGVRLNETKSLGDVNVEDNREYARVEIDFEWALKPVLFLQTGYGYTAQDFTEDLIPQKADSNSIYVGMSYRGLSRRR
jgi:hypothetical protein